MQTRYYAQAPAPQQNNLTTLILIGLAVYLFIAHSNGDWPFKPAPAPPGPGPVTPIDDDRTTPKPDDPQTDPTPAVKVKWLVVVHETKGVPAARQKVLDDYGFWFEELPKQGVRFRPYDVDDPAAQSYLYRAKAAQVDHPFVMAVDDSGGVRKVIPFPADVGAIRDLLK